LFIRVVKKDGDEVLFNVNSIWKIEIQHAIPQEGGPDLGVAFGADAPEAVRWYRVFFGSDNLLLRADPTCEGMKVIEELYTHAKSIGYSPPTPD
jgi:hypothetical protein